MISLTRISIATLVLSGSIHAQEPFDTLSSRRLGETFFSILDGPFGRTCALELNGDFRSDALVLVDDQVTCCFSPGIYQALVKLPRTAVDMCALGSRSPLGRDAILVTSDRPRLELWWLDEETSAFVVRSLGSPVWAGASELNAADLTGDGMPDAVGVSADHQTVIHLAHPFAMGGEGFLSIGETIHRLTPIEWEGTPGAELAILGSGGFGVYELDGTRVDGFGTDGDDSDRFCAVASLAQPIERLSGLFQVIDGSYYLVTSDQPAFDAFTWIGNLLPVAISAGDYSGDGLEDVCISHKNTGQLLYFENQSSTAPDAFNWDVFDLWDPTADGSGAAPAPENQAHALLEDLDQDGDGDVFFPVEKEDEIAMLRNDTLDHIARAPSVQGGVYHYDLPSGKGTLVLTLAAPALPPPQDEKVLLVVWRQPTLKDDVRTEPHAVHQALVKATDWPLTVSIPITEPLFTETLFHVELRLAESKATEVLSAAATAVWSFTTSASSRDDMTLFFGVPPESFLEVPILFGGESLLAGSGWTGPMPCVPSFDDDEIPDPGLDQLELFARQRVHPASRPK